MSLGRAGAGGGTMAGAARRPRGAGTGAAGRVADEQAARDERQEQQKGARAVEKKEQREASNERG